GDGGLKSHRTNTKPKKNYYFILVKVIYIICVYISVNKLSETSPFLYWPPETSPFLYVEGGAYQIWRSTTTGLNSKTIYEDRSIIITIGEKLLGAINTKSSLAVGAITSVSWGMQSDFKRMTR
ncbi:hypothetical protein ACJX0J_007164, partial [Zea mays]